MIRSVRQFSTKHHGLVARRYFELVSQGKIKSDPNQLAVVDQLDHWTDGFYVKQARLVQYKHSYAAIADFGQNAKAFKKQNEKM
jgi:hypothetical protein